jgi:7-cyano-7-deazaguanine synthase
MERFSLSGGLVAYLGNWRATPTTEMELGQLQPYDGLVHNGTIANDKELGGLDGEIDSQVLARVLNRTNLQKFTDSLTKVKGSYAIALVSRDTVWAACNYKPLHYWIDDHETLYFSSMARHFEGVVPFGQSPVQLTPYSTIDFLTGKTLPIPRTAAKRAVVVCSGGLDSVTVAAKMRSDGYEVCLLHFRYGCLAETRESSLIPLIAERLGAEYKFLSLPEYSRGSSSLFSDGSGIAEAVAGAEYAHEWVPARNLNMLSAAVAYAESNGYHVVALGNNLEESGSYPDNEEQMTVMLNAIMPYAVQNGYEMRIVSPVGHLMKHEIVKLGLSLEAPYDLSWSCYRGGNRHCGNCGPCYMRQTAFERNSAADPVFRRIAA